MIGFVAVKSLGGYNDVRPDLAMAVAGGERAKSNADMAGGIAAASAKAIEKVVARLGAAMTGAKPEKL
jgi:hypothetical protein